jgi:hypothetical protein
VDAPSSSAFGVADNSTPLIWCTQVRPNPGSRLAGG